MSDFKRSKKKKGAKVLITKNYFDVDWTEKSVLELGCNIGKMGLLVKERGARKYKGID